MMSNKIKWSLTMEYLVKRQSVNEIYFLAIHMHLLSRYDISRNKMIRIRQTPWIRKSLQPHDQMQNNSIHVTNRQGHALHSYSQPVSFTIALPLYNNFPAVSDLDIALSISSPVFSACIQRMASLQGLERRKAQKFTHKVQSQVT